MSDYATTTTGAYRLHAPAYQMFGPSRIEELYAKEMLTPGTGGLATGLGMGAQAAQRQAQAEYSLALDAVNARQQEIARQRMAGDIRAEQYKLTQAMLQNPNYSAALTLTRPLIAPEGAQTMGELATASAARQDAEARQAGFQAAQHGGNVGIAPPIGTEYDRYGVPAAPPVQGDNPDLVAARLRQSGEGGVKPGDVIRIADLQAKRQEWIEAEVGKIIRAKLMSTGVVRDANGQTIQGPKLSPEQEQAIEREARVNATAAAERAFGSFEQTLQRGGLGYLTTQPQPASPGYSLNTSSNPLLSPEVARGVGIVGPTSNVNPVLAGGLPQRNTAGGVDIPPGNGTRPPPEAVGRTGRADADTPADPLRTALAATGHSDAQASQALVMREVASLRAQGQKPVGTQVMTNGNVRIVDEQGNTLKVIRRE